MDVHAFGHSHHETVPGPGPLACRSVSPGRLDAAVFAGQDRADRDAALVPHDPQGERRVIPSGWERLDTHDGRPPCPLNLDRSLEVADPEPRARWEHFAPIEVFQYDVLHPPAPFHRDCAAEEGEGDQGPD